MQRRTRIVATLGPATDRPGVLEALLDLGLDVARINFAHGSLEELKDRIIRLRALVDILPRPVAVLLDLPGPKLRVVLDAPISLMAGQEVTLATGTGSTGQSGGVPRGKCFSALWLSAINAEAESGPS